ncbi:hypothetical protein F5884DRAFT_884750 [Xylogone sp. PMI_703]|nr:hypothetical protein F5884DRAFT_884750 [Xylogone sp. PMI_703]
MPAESRWTELWRSSKSIVLMVLAQLISSLMAVTSKLLQATSKEHEPPDTSQILITMMGITFLLSWIFMMWAKVESYPLGPRDLWPLLTIRSIAGVFGIWGFYYSLRYLILSEAIVINFLAPMVAAFASSVLFGIPLSNVQRVASVASIIGVVLVAQPWHSSDNLSTPGLQKAINGNFCGVANSTAHVFIKLGASTLDSGGSLERASGIGAALVGVVGGAIAYIVMTRLDKRAHPAVAVYHFALWTIVLTSFGTAIVSPDAFRMPTKSEWGLLLFMGVFGFGLQLLLAASLQCEKNSRALNIVYIQIVFSMIIDKVVWKISPSWLTLGGGAMILMSSFSVAALQRRERGNLQQEIYEEEGIETMLEKPEEGMDDLK